jgi:small acid-soluble spore protein E (minor gamma-type SASP)
VGKLIIAEVIVMANNPKRSAAGTNVEQVKKQNQQAAQGQQGQFGTEFASETDAQEVRNQNQKSQQSKK